MQILLLMIGCSFHIVCWQPEPPCSSSNYPQATMLERPGRAQADSALSHPPPALPAFPVDVPDVGVRKPSWKWILRSAAIQGTSSPRHGGTSQPCSALSAFLTHRIWRQNKVIHVYTTKFTRAPYTTMSDWNDRLPQKVPSGDRASGLNCVMSGSSFYSHQCLFNLVWGELAVFKTPPGPCNPAGLSPGSST